MGSLSTKFIIKSAEKSSWRDGARGVPAWTALTSFVPRKQPVLGFRSEWRKRQK